MPNSKPLSVSLIVCESALTETTGGLSAIRIMDVIHCGRLSLAARFFVITYLHSTPGEFEPHVLKVQMVGLDAGGSWCVIADAPEHKFLFGYKVDPSGPGGYALTTEFTLDLTRMGNLGTYFIQALLDGEVIAQTPLTLRRRD